MQHEWKISLINRSGSLYRFMFNHPGNSSSCGNRFVLWPKFARIVPWGTNKLSEVTTLFKFNHFLNLTSKLTKSFPQIYRNFQLSITSSSVLRLILINNKTSLSMHGGLLASLVTTFGTNSSTHDKNMSHQQAILASMSLSTNTVSQERFLRADLKPDKSEPSWDC